MRIYTPPRGYFRRVSGLPDLRRRKVRLRYLGIDIITRRKRKRKPIYSIRRKSVYAEPW